MWIFRFLIFKRGIIEFAKSFLALFTTDKYMSLWFSQRYDLSTQAWARLCKCLGQEFLPYMSVVMPPLLRSAQLKPDVTITDADSEDEGNESDDDRYGYQLYWKLLKVS